jgi:ferrochelatase
VADRLGLEEEAFMTTFQSRFGKAKWLQPYTDMVMKTLPEQNVRSVQVVCPGFSSDCLETIEEIGVENRDYFLQAGGERYEYIPALNQSDVHMDMLEQLVEYHAAGWRWSRESSEELKARLSRVEACPYNRL